MSTILPKLSHRLVMQADLILVQVREYEAKVDKLNKLTWPSKETNSEMTLAGALFASYLDGGPADSSEGFEAISRLYTKIVALEKNIRNQCFETRWGTRQLSLSGEYIEKHTNFPVFPNC